MGKNRRNKNQAQPKLVTAPIVKGITADQKNEIEQLQTEVNDAFVDMPEAVEMELSAEESKMADEAAKNEDVQKYLRYLTDANRRLSALISNAEKKKAELEQREEKLKAEKKEFEDSEKTRKADLDKQEEEFKESTKERIESLNQKEKEVLEREMCLDTGEYTGTIRSLLDKLTAAEKEICQGTADMIDNLAKKNANYQHLLCEIADKEAELEQQKSDFEVAQKEFRRQQKKAQIEQKIQQEKYEREIKDQFQDELDETKANLDRALYENKQLQQSVDSLSQLKDNIVAVCGGADPEVLAREIQKLREERDSLKQDRDSRPTMQELEEKNKHIAEITAAYEKIQSELDEKALLMLRERLNLSDHYVIEIQGYEQQLKNAQSTIASLNRVKEDMQITIDQLKGERQKDYEAFEFARTYDKSEALRTQIRRKTPKTLCAFSNYIQAKLASKEDNPLYYDIDTIKSFIAGLFMSNISILQGISGTGKTSLPKEFANAMTADDVTYVGDSEDKSPNAPYRICAVQSGWRDRMDLMGFYNSFEHKYRETEFFKALYLANTPKYSNTLFLIILDEMNLSRPEHYFADFLSLLELDEERRYVDIDGNEQVWPELIAQNRGKLKVPENVRFIGTANHDETTLSFAPKTYDRSNLMEMPKNYVKVDATTSEAYSVTYKWLNDEFNKALKKHEQYYVQFKNFIESKKIHDLLADKGLGTGNRFDKQAKRFICMYIACGEDGAEKINLSKAADHLVSSRLLRTIGDNYDLTKGSLQSFMDEFCSEFKKVFGNEPQKVKSMLEQIIAKRQ